MVVKKIVVISRVVNPSDIVKKDVTVCYNTQLRSHKSMNYLINPVKNHVIFGPRELQNSKGHGFATRPLPDLHAAFAAATGGDRKQRIDEASYLSYII